MRRLHHPTFADARTDAIVGSIQLLEIWNGTEGNDTHTGTNQDDTLNGNGGDDTLNGGGGGDLLDGGEGNDVLAGDAGDDILLGGTGDDTISSTAEADDVDGGEGADVWIGYYSALRAALTFDQGAGTLSNGTKLKGIESIYLYAGSGADRFAMTGDQTFYVSGGDGADTFVFDPTNGSRSAASLTIDVSIVGGSFSVTLQDGAVVNRADRVESLALVGSSGNDVFNLNFDPRDPKLTVSIDGGDGNDRLMWDLGGRSSTTFIVRRDGTVDSTYGTISNIENFFLGFGSGKNIVKLGRGDDTIYANGTGDQIDGGGGNDFIYASNGTGAAINGGAGNDSIYVGHNARAVKGGSGNDKITLFFETKTVYGGDGDDQITNFLTHADTVDGGAGYDEWIDAPRESFSYDQETGKLPGVINLIDVEHITLQTYYQGSGSSIRLVRDDDVSLILNSDHDTVDIDLQSLSNGVTVSGSDDGQQHFHVAFGATDITAITQSAPAISFVATNRDDVFQFGNLNASKFFTVVDGGAGFDILGLTLTLGSEFLVGDDGTITSSSGRYLNFEQFDITALGGANVIALGGGDDAITVSVNTNDTNDLSGGGGADVITAAKGADRLDGGEGNDTLIAGDGNDVLSGGAGNDILNGGAGSDTAGYYTATSGVTVAVQDGAQDTGGAGVDTLTSIENLNGSTFNDTLTGDGFANQLRGREGDDVLTGGDGADRLEGGAGADRMTGGTSADVFAFVKIGDISLGVRDRILDFSHADGDKIDLSAIDLSKDPGDQQFTFIGTSAFTGSADLYELRIQDQHNGTFLVLGDVNHDAKADFIFAVLAGATPLVAADFVL